MRPPGTRTRASRVRTRGLGGFFGDTTVPVTVFPPGTEITARRLAGARACRRVGNLPSAHEVQPRCGGLTKPGRGVRNGSQRDQTAVPVRLNPGPALRPQTALQ